VSSFLPPFFPFGRRPSPFYHCQCPNCGFQEGYELGTPVEDDDPDGLKIVEKIPDVCPKCGAKWKKTHMPDLRKF